MRLKLALSIAVLIPLTAFAKFPTDIADLVGARAAGSESEMKSRGYVDIGVNAGTKTCVRVHVSQGHYSAISQINASACGQDGGNSTQCARDLSQADPYKHPGRSL